MAYESLKKKVNNYIKDNGHNDITAEILNGILNAMIDALGEASGIVGIMPSSSPDAGDANITYITLEDGMYPNFNGIEVTNEVAFIKKRGGVFVKESYPIPTQIKNVRVNVDCGDPTATPSGEASVSGDTLTITLHNIKGDKGEHVNIAMDLDSTNIAETGTPSAIVEEVTPAPRGYDQMFKITLSRLKGERGKSAFEVWMEIDGNEDKTIDDFMRYLAKNWEYAIKAYYASAASTIGGTCTKLASDFGVSDAERGVVYLMPNDASTPTKTRMYILDDEATAFIYVGDMDVDASTFVKKVDIDDVLDNPKEGDVADAKNVMRLKTKIEDIVVEEKKIDDYVATSQKRVGVNGNIESIGRTGCAATTIEIPNGTKSIRFLGVKVESSWTISTYHVGYAFGRFDNETWNNISQVDYEQNTSNDAVVKEYTADVPYGATHVRITCAWNKSQSGSGVLNNENFYLYAISGDRITDLFDKSGLNDYTENGIAMTKDVFQLKSKIGDFELPEEKVEVVTSGDGKNVYDGFINTNGIISNANNYYKYYFKTEIPEGAKKVRFSKPTGNWANSGWAFGNIVDDVFVPKRHAVFENNQETELILDVKDGETVFVTTCGFLSAISKRFYIDPTNFYCYFKIGNTISDNVRGKLSYDEFSEYCIWKKNLIDAASMVYGYVYTKSGDNIVKTDAVYGVLSSPLYLKDNVVYTFSNVNVYASVENQRVGGEGFGTIVMFDAQDNPVRFFQYSAVVTKTDNNPNKNTGTFSMKWKLKEGEVYARIRLRYNASQTDTTYNDWKQAQAEVGEIATEFSEYHSEKTFDIKKKSDDRKEVNILAIGNSNSQDTLSYVPYLIRSIAPDIKLNIDIAYLGSSGIPNHLNNFLAYERDPNASGTHGEYNDGVLGGDITMYNNGKSYDRHFIYFTGTHWRTGSTKVSIQQLIDREKWDFILLNATSFSSPIILLIDKILSYIAKKEEPYNPIFGVINPAISIAKGNGRFYAGSNDETHGRPYPEDLSENPAEGTLQYRWKAQLDGALETLNKTLCQYVFPVNAAVCNALTVDEIKKTGDFSKHSNNRNWIDDNDHSQGCYGYLRAPDGVHLQEGLPCQIAAYAFICKLLDILGMDTESVFCDKTICDEDWLEDKNDSLPGMNPNENSGPSYSKNYTIVDVLAKSPTGWSENANVNIDRVLFAQKCAVMAVKKPFEITDMGNFYGIKYAIMFHGNNSHRENTTSIVGNGESYTTSVYADYECTINNVVVKMSGTDITETAYNPVTHLVSIPSVTGNVSIYVSATKNQV